MYCTMFIVNIDSFRDMWRSLISTKHNIFYVLCTCYKNIHLHPSSGITCWEREREREIMFSSCRPIWLATQLRVFEEIINALIYIYLVIFYELSKKIQGHEPYVILFICSVLWFLNDLVITILCCLKKKIITLLFLH